ncbi:ArgS-related anticodon-binding protein NrtL [Streptomyces sp. NPDC086081]|uniref:ArgS-related anticodon-binding protein NrtL n=1 Tax=Streptomyces sp. NPDC086081 TaxID=3365749 RepID=UPI0037FBDC14
MTPVELSRTVLHAVRRAVDAGELSVTVPERVVVTPPGPGGCGDFATNIALQLARAAGQPPRRVAEILRARLLDEHRVADVVVTGPGFLNLRLEGTASADLVGEILRRGLRYGHGVGSGSSGTLVRLRCPAEVRAVVVADAIARVRRSQGDLVRVQYDGPPAVEWTSELGVGAADPHEPRPRSRTDGGDVHVNVNVDLDLTVRPVPAPADPLPLGRDAARWALLYPAAHDRPRITREHLVQRETNPLFRVRYAHARTRALLRNAADLGFHPEPGPVRPMSGPEHATSGAGQSATSPVPAVSSPVRRTPTPVPPAPTPTPVHETDVTPLLALLGDHPRVLGAAQDAPDRLARHLVAVADATLPLLPAVLPLGEEKPSAAHRARLALAEAAGTVLAGGLSLLGIDAPEHL